MAATQLVGEITRFAGADLRTNEFCFVKTSTAADNTVLLAGAADQAIGVLGNKPNINQAALVQISGIAKVIYGATVTAGDLLESDASGHAITRTSTHAICGVAQEAGVVNEIHSILLPFHVT